MADGEDPNVGQDPASGSESAEQELARLKSENQKLRQDFSRVSKLNSEATPYMRALYDLGQTEEGKGIIKKLMTGELLTKREEKKVAASEERAGESITKADLDEFKRTLLQDVETTLHVSAEVREDRKSIDAWAAKEFPGYDTLRDSVGWKRQLSLLVDELDLGVKNGLYTVPAKYKDDVVRWGIARLYASVKADNPELGEKTKEKKTSEQKEAEKIAASSVGAGSSGKTDELPAEHREEILAIRRATSPAVFGKSYSRS